MDVKLVGAAVQFHGEELLDSLTDEQGEEPSSNITAYLQRHRPLEPEIKDKAFRRSLCGFIARKSDLLFRPLTEEEKNCNRSLEAVDDSFAIMPPLETFMGVPSYLRREEFWKSLRVNDCVTGVVTSIIDQGLRLALLCIDKGVCRDIDDLNIPAFCPVKELPQLYAKESALDAFQTRDIVRGIVLSVVEEAERIIISLKAESVPDENLYPRIGLITEDDFPVHYRRQSQIQDMSYEEMLQSILGFNNNGNVISLTQQLQVPTDASYFRFFSRLKIPPKEYAEGLKKWQSQKLAHHSVVQGVEMFKKGDYIEAMQHLNRALQVDAENVEALVARGALYANNENFPNAIKDFEEALSLNPKHTNAKNYLIETQLTVGRMCEERRELKKAVSHYESVLKIDEHHPEASELLDSCRQLLIFQTGPDEIKEEDAQEKSKKSVVVESSDEEDVSREKTQSSSSVLKTSTDKLKALIKEDRERKPRSAKKDKKRRMHSSSSERDTRKQKQRKKKRRRVARSSSTGSPSSDSDSDSSASSSQSRSSSPERGRKRHRKKKGKDKKRNKKIKRSRKNSESSKRLEKQRPEISVEREVPEPKRTPERSRHERPVETGERSRLVREEVRHRQKDEPKSSPKKEENEDDISRSAAASFLPVSSFDFFSKSTAIPGLGSPPPSSPVHPSAIPQESHKRFSLLRDGSSVKKEGLEVSQSANCDSATSRSPTEVRRSYRNQSEMFWDSRDSENYYNRSIQLKTEPGLGDQERRNEVLIAQREQFYKGNNEAEKSYRRFRSSSSSGSSRSRSGSRAKSQGSAANKEPRPHDHSSVVTGIKELDRYLGGSKHLLQKAMEAKGFLSWEELAGKIQSDKLRSPSPKRFKSGSPSTTRFKSRSPSPKRFGSSTLKRNRSNSSSPRRFRSGSPSPKRYKSRSPPSKSYHQKLSSPYSTRQSSRSPEFHDRKSSSREKSQGSPLTYGWQMTLQNLRMGQGLLNEGKHAVDSKPENRRSRSPHSLVGKGETQEEEGKANRSISSFGKFGPIKKQAESLEKTASTDLQSGSIYSPQSHSAAAGPGNRGKTSVAGKSEGKRDSKSFLPRVLRRPMMDDPEVNKSLVPSNQIKWDKKSGEKSLCKPETREAVHGTTSRSQQQNLSDTGKLEKEEGRDKPRASRWDKQGKQPKQDAPAEAQTADVIARLSSLDQNAGEKAKRQLEEEMEREIERRVQERLRQQQESNTASSESKRERGKDSSKDKEGQGTKKKDRRHRGSSSGVESDDSKRHDRRGSRERRHSRKRDRESEDDEQRSGYKRQPWRGRAEVIERKKGWCEDRFGNTYFAQYGKPLKVGRNFDAHGNVFFTDSLSLKHHDVRRHSPGSRRQERSSSRSSSSSQSPKRRRSRSTEKVKSQANKERDKESKTGQSASSESKDAGLAAQSPRVTTSGVSEKPAEMIDKNDAAGPSDLESVPRSRWDDEDSSKDTKPERGRGDSLTDLEKFLVQLKQQKKKQWIAEGKIKEN